MVRVIQCRPGSAGASVVVEESPEGSPEVRGKGTASSASKDHSISDASFKVLSGQTASPR